MLTRRTIQVVALLTALGAAAGAFCGAIAVLPLAIQHAFWPTGDDGLIGSATSWLPITIGVGAIIGGLLGPIVSLTLLRRIPLGRILLHLSVAGIIGVLVSWTPAIFRFDSLPSSLRVFAPLWLPAACALAAAIGLRRLPRNQQSVHLSSESVADSADS